MTPPTQGEGRPRFLFSECPECLTRRSQDEEQIIPCPECGCSEVENVWSDGQRTDAFEDAQDADGEPREGYEVIDP